MVLQNKWDKRATRDRARKFKAKGKELPEHLKNKSKQSGGPADDSLPSRPVDSQTPSHALPSDSEPETDSDSDSSLDGILLGTNPADLPQRKPKPSTAPNTATKPEGETPEDEDEDDATPSQFSRRKLQSNAWRYETTEDPDLPFTHGSAAAPAPEEPEPDYVALTLSRPSAALNAPVAPTPELDQAFLAAAVNNRYNHAELPAAKSIVQKVDKAAFKEVEEKIKKKSNADAFRARFAAGPKKVRTPVAVDEDLDDVDGFLGELELGDVGRGGAPVRKGGDVRVERAEAKAAPVVGDADDEWLDSMLGRG